MAILWWTCGRWCCLSTGRWTRQTWGGVTECGCRSLGWTTLGGWGETLLDIAPNNTSGSCSKWCACHSYTFAATYVRSIAGRNKTLTRLDSVYVNFTNLHVQICHPKHRSCHPTQNPAGINYQTLHFCEPIKMIKLLHAMVMVMYIQAH